MNAFLVYVYFMASVLVGYFGRDRVFGFLGFFLLSILLTPLLSGLILVLSARRRA